MLATLGLLLVGAVLGAGGSLLVEDRSADVGTGGDRSSTAALAPDPGPITIALAGDVALADGSVGSPADLVGALGDVLADADVAVVNLDVPVVDDPAAVEVPAAPRSILDALTEAGVDVISLANDRSLALGFDAVSSVVASEEGSQRLVGVGLDEADAYEPFVRHVGGHAVAVIAATQLLEPDRIASDTAGPGQAGVASAKRVDRLVSEVEAARAVADTVVVYLHWGTTGQTCPSTGQQELAAALVEAGADVVAGPGSGRVQGAGRSGGAAVAYGLGALVAAEPEEVESGVLLVEVDGREVLGLEWVAARRSDGVPAPLTGADADAVVAEWESRRDCTDLTP